MSRFKAASVLNKSYNLSRYRKNKDETNQAQVSGQIPKGHIKAGDITKVFRVFVITDFEPYRISPNTSFKLRKKKFKTSHSCERCRIFLTFDEPNDEQNNEQNKDKKVSPQLKVD